MNDGLKPCPFCGKLGDCNNVGVCDKDGNALWWVECPDCGCNTAGHKTRESAVAAWNRRAEPANEPLTLEELQQIDSLDAQPVFAMWRIDESDEFAEDKWYICGDNPRGIFDCFSDGHLFEDYGKTWLAYRRKPEGGK